MSYTSHHTSQCERATFQVLSSVCNANSTTAVCIAFEVLLLLRSDALDMLGQVSILLSLSFVTCKPSPPQPRWPCSRGPRLLPAGLCWCLPSSYSWAPQALPLSPHPAAAKPQWPLLMLHTHFTPQCVTPVEGLKKTRAGFCVKHFKSFLHLSAWINVRVPLCGIHSSHDLGICASWKVSLSLCG